jgi:glucose-6-phosphate isomerase
MLYKHDTKNCFADAIGDRGLDVDSYSGVLEEASVALDAIREAYKNNSIPMLGLPEASSDIESLKPLVERCRRDFDTMIVLGTGGSSLGGQTLCSLADVGFGPQAGSPRLYFIDNVDPNTFETLFKCIDVGRTGFIVISKSGSTAETIAQFIVCLNAIDHCVGEEKAAGHVFMIVDPGDNPLRRIADNRGMTTLDHDPDVGGRFSVLSNVGLLPAMISGLDPMAIRAGATHVLKAALEAKSPADCKAAVGAAISISLFRDKGATSTVIMPYADRLSNFGQWFQQLWAESLGKDGTGTTPIPALGTRDQHSQMQLYLDGPQDKMFTLLTLDVANTGRQVCAASTSDASLSYLNGRSMGDLLSAEQKATQTTLAGHGCPTRIFRVKELNEEILGALLMHFMLETIIAAHLLGVNPFDQPAVEEGKRLTRHFLSEMDVDG